MVFENPEFDIIHTMTDENGEPLFCGKDVCKALGHRIPQVTVRKHVNPRDVTKRVIGLTIGKKRGHTPEKLFFRRYGALAVPLKEAKVIE